MSDESLSRKDRKKPKDSKNSHTNKSKNTSKKRGTFKKIFVALVVMAGVMMIVGAITVFAIFSNAPELDEELLTLSQNPDIMDMNDETVTNLEAAENRQSADIEDMPPVLLDAVISVEDVRFYDHFGVDLRRIGGAVLANITGGFGSEGASTITQQVVKNLFLDFDKTITRKLQEQYLAVKLEQQFTKDQILEMYLNAIYFSDSRYGVVEAANYYFSKELDELTIEDAALLAGIPQRPNAHNPFNNPRDAESRRNTVINRMESNNKITSEQAETARNIPVEEQLNPGETAEQQTNEFQSYIDQVLNEVEEIEGIEASDIYTSGLKIYTNLDQDLQRHTEQVLQNDENFPDDQFQAGITLMETQTGQVRAIGGMRQPAEAARTMSMATTDYQTGSTMKPILDYGPAIDQLKWSTFHQIVDEEYSYSTGDPVRNFSRSFQGSVSVREALKQSINVPAVKTLHEVGLDNAQQFGQKLGIPLDDMYESYALGANEVSSFQLTGAYAAFGNEGEYNEPHTVRKVEFPDGRVIDLAPEPVQAMNDYTAFMISDMLKDVVQSGTGTAAQISGLPVAGKTGSTNFTPEQVETHDIPSSAIKDAWFAGYTTELAAAVWTGYKNPSDGQIIINNNEHQVSRDIFKEVMSYAHQDRETSDFPQPDSVVEVGVERSTGLLPSSYTPDSEIIYEYFVRGTEPSNVSEEFEVEEVEEIDEAVNISGLQASYDPEAHAIFVEWSYPQDSLEEFSFRLEVRAGSDSDYTTISESKELQYVLENPEYGETYSFQVTAVHNEDNDIQSDPVTAEVVIPEEEEEPEEEELEENPENEEPIEEEPIEEEPTDEEIEEPVEEVPADGENSGDNQEEPPPAENNGGNGNPPENPGDQGNPGNEAPDPEVNTSNTEEEPNT
ncbi:penicillin-binding protein [Salipaludibacillus neizhouensis]|uniref:Penicillin-binding protein n=1 Tax=Salipaludibacillus neizhouensis TaxID=885475 RepID=A0A3A9K4J0_9BACI|nr:penicillin-binding protein 1A [Salipaludibacillus neizhouensis]RKL67547.1 penicillin-binding protein [Salipaludibacillus neizhouensis]